MTAIRSPDYILSMSGKDERWPNFRRGEIGEGKTDKDYITGLGGHRHTALAQ